MVNARQFVSALTCAMSIACSRTMLAQTEVRAVAAAAVATGQVRGVVFDSLLMKPASRASVWVAGGALTTIADSLGRFELNNVPVGTQLVSFSSASLDSLGLPTSGKSVDVTSGGASQVVLNTPSFKTVWRALCSAATNSGKDSAIVWGTVRDAETLTLQSGAAARFNWLDTRVKKKEVSLEPRTYEVRTDNTGTYYACGLPLDIRISAEGAGTKSATGPLEYMIGKRRVFRADLLVSTEMVRPPLDSSKSSPDSVSTTFQGTSILRGVLRDESGKPVVGAVVAILSMDSTVRSDTAGSFVLRNAPAGTQLVEVRQIGFAPAASLVDMRPSAVTTTQLSLNRTVELKPVNVRANRVRPLDRIGYDERKRTGWGVFLESKDFQNAFHVGAIVQALPNVYVSKTNRGTSIFMKEGIRSCVPSIFIDGFRASVDDAMVRSVDSYRAVEVYNRRSTAPSQYSDGNCGSILFWTWSARW